MRGFFGAQCLTNGEQIWQKAQQLKLSIWSLFVDEIERKFFLPNAVRKQLFAWQKKFGEIDPKRQVKV